MVDDIVCGVPSPADTPSGSGTHSASRTGSPTGFDRLDEGSGGFREGRVWLVTGAPGQGCSTLLNQWAVDLAVRHGWLTALCSPRDGPERVNARLRSAVERALMSTAADEGRDARRLAEAEELLRAAALLVRADTSIGPPVWRPDAPRPRALVLDDIDLMVPTVGPQQLISAASEGNFVVAMVPRHRLVSGPNADDDLDPHWARAADLVLELRSFGRHRWHASSDDEHDPTGLPAVLSPGEASLIVLKNRWGPLFAQRLYNECWRARFRSATPAPD